MSLIAATAISAAPAPADLWSGYVAEAATRFALPPAWISQVMQAESHGRVTLNGRPITSSAGAMGLMQLMPATWKAIRVRYHLGLNPYDPHDNIIAGAAYIRRLYDCYGAPGFLAAYNAGPGRLDQYLLKDRPLPAETRRYVASFQSVATAASVTPSPPAKPSLFVVRNDVPTASAAAMVGTSVGLFVTLGAPVSPSDVQP